MAVSVAGDSQDSLERSIHQDPGMFGAGSWKALGLLLNRPYWNRVWIMQELAMGSEKTPILCGEDTITWGELYDGVYEFGRRIDDLMFLHIEMESKQAGVDYRGLNRHKIIHLRMEQLVQAGATFSHHMPVLDLARKSYATDLRDKVYGILGLVPPKVATLTDVNYEKEPDEVYTSFTGAWMAGSKFPVTFHRKYRVYSWLPVALTSTSKSIRYIRTVFLHDYAQADMGSGLEFVGSCAPIQRQPVLLHHEGTTNILYLPRRWDDTFRRRLTGWENRRSRRQLLRKPCIH